MEDVKQKKSLQKKEKRKKTHNVKKRKSFTIDKTSFTPSDEEERELERLVFGGEEDVIENLRKPKKPKASKNKQKVRSEDEPLELVNIPSSDVTANPIGIRSTERKAVWEDEDDDNILVEEKAKTLIKCPKDILLKKNEKYSEHLRSKYLEMRKTPKWANLDRLDEEDSADDSDEDILQTTGNFLERSKSLPSRNIGVHKCRHLNYEEKSNTILKSVEFHPHSQVALVAGFSGTATLFQVDGKTNAKIQSMHFERFPIHTAHFTVDGNEIVVGSKEYGYYYFYDMMVGKIVKVPWDRGTSYTNMRRFHMSPDGKFIAALGRFGNIHLITAKTKEIVSTLKMNGDVYSIDFTSDGTKMFSHGNTGEVYVWDVNARQCIHKFSDEGCVSGSSLALSPNNQYLACGSDMGIVNIYETSTLLTTSSPQPVKAFLNLTTEVTGLKFNSTSEMLVMSSFVKDNAIKLVHVPSMSVFSNFPIFYQNLHHPHCFDISLNSGYLSVGSNYGTAYLFRLKHYNSY